MGRLPDVDFAPPGGDEKQGRTAAPAAQIADARRQPHHVWLYQCAPLLLLEGRALAVQGYDGHRLHPARDEAAERSVPGVPASAGTRQPVVNDEQPLSLRRRALADAPLEDRQRHRAFLQDLVELLDVELRPKRLLRLGAGAGPGRMADLVAARLADHRAITLDLALRP